MTNPFLTDWTTKNGAVPYDIIKLEHFKPAIDHYLKLAYEKIESIKANTETSNFDNTILAIEGITEDLDMPVSVYFNLVGVESDSAFKDLANEISPLLAQLSNAITADSTLFEKVKVVFDSKGKKCGYCIFCTTTV